SDWEFIAGSFPIKTGYEFKRRAAGRKLRDVPGTFRFRLVTARQAARNSRFAIMAVRPRIGFGTRNNRQVPPDEGVPTLPPRYRESLSLARRGTPAPDAEGVRCTELPGGAQYEAGHPG